MKRPGPLPAARPTRPAEIEPADPGRDALGDVVPFDPGAGRRDGLDGDERAHDDNSRSAEPGDREIGWRELWRASWARRRALRAEIRRFTARTRRRRWLWIGGAAAVALVIGGSVGAAYSPLFAVRNVLVVGSKTLDETAVEQALASQIGTPLPLVDHSAVKAALLEFPLIETYAIEARPPHDLVIRIVERTPVGVVQTDAGFTVVDAAGVALSTTPERPEGQPLVSAEGGPGSDAFAAVGQVLRSLPQSLRDQVSEAAATTPQNVTLTLGATGTQVIWGTADDSAMKALVLEKTMTARPPDGVSVYDVSSYSAVVVR